MTNTSLPDTQCNIADDCLALSWSNLSSFAAASMHVLIAILGFCMEMTLAGDTTAFLQSDCVAMWVAAGTTRCMAMYQASTSAADHSSPTI